MFFSELSKQLTTLKQLLSLLNEHQYNKKIAYLGNASIGGHTRHIIELLKCATSGYQQGIVDYVCRERNLILETDKAVAIHELSLLEKDMLQPDKSMKLVTGYQDDTPGFVNTTFFREILYNVEHAIHHFALIRVALREMELNLVPEDFGLAYSTKNYLTAHKNIQHLS